jgi:epoxyqueuosine reductase
VEELFDSFGENFLWGCVGADAKADAQAEERYRAWLRRSLHADMPCLTESAALKAHPALALPGAKSILMFAVPYPSAPALQTPSDPAEAAGLVALYARGRDYHRAMGALLKRIVKMLAGQYPGAGFRAFCDTLPLSERACALKAGLGSILHSGLLANDYFGTRFVLGGVLTTLPLAGDMPEMPRLSRGLRTHGRQGISHPAGLRLPQGAGLPQGDEQMRVCRDECAYACVRACPATALGVDSDHSPGSSLDISRCLAWLSIEYKGVIDRERWHVFGNRIFGCDVCQDVCRYNISPIFKDALSYMNTDLFASAHAAGAHLSLSEILSIRDSGSFARRFSGTALMRAGRRGLVRNAIIVAVNTNCVSAYPLIAGLREDADEVIAETARSADIGCECGRGEEGDAKCGRLTEGARSADA